MKSFFTIIFATLSLAACTANQAPQAIDNTPGTQTSNEYKAPFPCSEIDSRHGNCPPAAK